MKYYYGTFVVFDRGVFLLRVFGYGFQLKRAEGHRPLFSERYGYRKAYYFAGLRLQFFKP